MCTQVLLTKTDPGPLFSPLDGSLRKHWLHIVQRIVLQNNGVAHFFLAHFFLAHATKSSYSVRVRKTDINGVSLDQAFTTSVTTGNVAPIGLTLSNSSVVENSPAGTTIGSLNSTKQHKGKAA